MWPTAERPRGVYSYGRRRNARGGYIVMADGKTPRDAVSIRKGTQSRISPRPLRRHPSDSARGPRRSPSVCAGKKLTKMDPRSGGVAERARPLRARARALGLRGRRARGAGQAAARRARRAARRAQQPGHAEPRQHDRAALRQGAGQRVALARLAAWQGQAGERRAQGAARQAITTYAITVQAITI